MRTLNNKGISLIELLVAVAILTISGTTLFYGFVAAARTSTKTSQRQMAQDAAQKIIEEFQNSTVVDLKNTYSAFCDDSEMEATLNRPVYKFTDIAYTYSVRSGQPDANFVADVTLTPMVTKYDAAGNIIETPGTTTYKQNGDDTTFYAVNATTGTNSFIIPETRNIYDGSSFVIQNEMNEYDSSVVSNLYAAVYAALQEKNDQIRSMPVTPKLLISLDQFDSDFSSRYIPLTNLYGSSAKLEKEAEFELIGGNAASGKAKYSYVIRLKYTFDFDFDLLLTNGTVVSMASLSSMISDGPLSTFYDDGSGAPVPTSVYTVEKNGTKYTVTYEKDLATDTGIAGKKGTSGGIVERYNTEDGSAETTFDEDNLARVYVLYNPFDAFSNSTNVKGEYKASDLIKFKYSGTSSSIPQVFFVVQDTPHLVNISKNVIMTKVETSIGSGAGGFPDMMLFTNSANLIDTASNGVNPENYLTNSQEYYLKYIESTSTDPSKQNLHFANFYSMKVVIKDELGRVIAEVDTVKED